jgi:hypothetical protein
MYMRLLKVLALLNHISVRGDDVDYMSAARGELRQLIADQRLVEKGEDKNDQDSLPEAR